MLTMLSVGTLAVYAKEITCAEPIKICTARTDVSVEIGNEQLTGIAVEVDLGNGKLVLTRDPIVTRRF
jgi:hypothetical protein